MVRGGSVEVVGAGAWGLAAAVALLESGTGAVRVWEREHPGSGATSRAAGLVSTHLRQTSDIRLVLETRRRLQRLRSWGAEQGSPAATHVYHAVGALTFVPEHDVAMLERLRQRIQSAGGTCDLLQSEDLGKGRWPLKSAAGLVGLSTKQDGYVEAGDLIELLRARVRDLGGTLYAETPVRLRVEGDACRGVEGRSGFVAAERVVLAAGAWSKEIMARSGLVLPIKAYRTQLAQLEVDSSRFPVFHDTEQRVYGRPDGAHRMLVGDGTEFEERRPDDFVATADTAFVEHISHAFSHRWALGDEARYRTGWAGLCVATPDRDPIVGPDPRVQGLHLMVGDNGFGVMRSLALGRIVADRIQGRRPPEAKALDPARLDFGADFPIREGFEL